MHRDSRPRPARTAARALLVALAGGGFGAPPQAYDGTALAEKAFCSRCGA